MDFNIPDKQLKKMSLDGSYVGQYSSTIADRFRQALQILDAVSEESVLAKIQSLKYKKIPGRGLRRRIALTDEIDLIVSIRNGNSEQSVTIEKIARNVKGRK